MIKRSLFFLTIWTLTDAYISRTALMNRMRAPVAFRPGVVLPRPVYPRVMPAMRRAPYVIYRNPSHRMKMNQIPPRNIFNNSWRTRQPMPVVTPEYEYVRPAPPAINTDTGAIHTIPAPNLSLSEKPIVVVEEDSNKNEYSNAPKPTYEVTEKYSDQPLYNVHPKIEKPVGFSKASTLSAAELQSIMRQNAALQLASEYGLPVIQLPQTTIIPQQFSIQGFHGMTGPHEFIHRGSEQVNVPNRIYHQDPLFMHNLQAQFLQYPAIEFAPFIPDIQTTQPPEPQNLHLLQNEQITNESENKNIVSRDTLEIPSTSMSPKAFARNDSENLIEIDVTTENVTKDTDVTTVKSFENNKTTPIYYAQIGESVGNVVANGFYSAINDARAMEVNEKLQQEVKSTTTNAPSTSQTEKLSIYHEGHKDTKLEDFKNLLGSPFEKTAESINVAYTILRADQENQNPKINKGGEVLAGQVVEAKISEDQEFNQEKASLAKRPPLLYAVTEKITDTSPKQTATATVVKAKIPPKSKLIFDDKTGEPILRIYASYVDNTAQKELLTAKLSNMKYKEVSRLQESSDGKPEPVKNFEKSLASDANQIMQFGLKMKSRNDDNIAIFNQYEQ